MDIDIYFLPYYNTSMITIKCSTPDTTYLRKLVPFQGDLKKRSEEDIRSLGESIQREGLLMPFAVWEHEDKQYLLDGHGRMSALVHLSLSDPTILEQELPCIIITADTEEDARKALLQITSTYGKINPSGVLSFSSTILDFHAPVLIKAQKKVELKAVKEVQKGKGEDDSVVIKIKVKKANVQAVKGVLSQVDMITVL